MAALSAPSALAHARPDPFFGAGGLVTRSALNLTPAFAAAETPGQRLIAVGDAGEDGDDYYVTRFRSDGTLDSAFGDGGIVHPARTEFIKAVAIQNDGKIVLVGPGFKPPSPVLGTCAIVRRLKPNGSADNSFGGSRRPSRRMICLDVAGIAETGLVGRAVAVSRGGKIVIGGVLYKSQNRDGAFIARLTPGGELDHSLRGDRRTRTSSRGVVQILPPRGFHGAVNEVKALRRGKTLIGGYLRGRFMAARFRSDGSLDRSFGRGGIASFDLDGKEECECSFGEDMVRDRHGRIILAGYTEPVIDQTRHLVVIRLHRDGSLDRTFGRRGMARPKLPEDFLTTAVAVQRDGRIVVSGQYNFRYSLVRFNPNGHLDRSFFHGGVFATWILGRYGAAWDVLIDQRGRIVASGGTDEGGFALMRFLSG